MFSYEICGYRLQIYVASYLDGIWGELKMNFFTPKLHKNNRQETNALSARPLARPVEPNVPTEKPLRPGTL